MNIDTLVNRLRPLAHSVEKRPCGDEFYFNVRFHCAYADDTGWHWAGGNGTLRFSNFNIPKIDGKEKEYRAPAVRPGGEAR